MNARKYGAIVTGAVIAVFTANVQAAFIVEAHSSGLANENFTGSGTASLRSFAPGTTASNSIFGGSDDYLYSYTPAIDVDNYLPPAGTDLTNNHVSSGIVGGAPGLYNVYITWPASTNVDQDGCNITVTSEGDDIYLDPVNMNTGGTGTPGGNSGWYRIAEKVRLVTGRTYAVHQVANDPSYVSQRSHGVMWQLVEPDPQLATIVQTDGTTSVAEGGNTDTYSISLAEEPPQAVVITAEALDPNQVILNGQMDKLELTFTPQNWNVEQDVTVAAFDDEIVEGDHAVMILHLINLADPNSDPNSTYMDGFGGLVMVQITDNEVPDVRIVESGGSTDVAEQNSTSDTYTMRLLFPPTDNVTINITADDDTLVDTGSGAAQDAALLFTPGNWQVEQTVTVFAVDDDVLEYAHNSTISHAVTSLDGGYDGLEVGAVLARIEDNECKAWGILLMDFNEDCYVDIADLAEFASSWLNCTQPYAENCVDLR